MRALSQRCRALRGFGLLGALLACACTEPQPTIVRRELVIDARTPDGRPVALVSCWSNGTQLGATDAQGRLRAHVQGKPAEALTLTFACPAEYTTSTPKRTLVLAGVAQRTAAAISLDVECRSLEIQTAVVVRAHGARAADLPVRVRGEAIARTDAQGHAHAVVRSRPGTALRVELDTRHDPLLRPESPTRTFQLGSTDDLVLFDQALSREAKRKPAARPLPPTSTAPHKPYRID